MDLAKCGDRVVEVMKHQRHDRPVDGLFAEPIQRMSNIVDPKIRAGAHSSPRMLDQLCAAVEANDVGPALCEFRGVQTRPAADVQDPAARDVPEKIQHSRTVIVGVVGTVFGVSCERVGEVVVHAHRGRLAVMHDDCGRHTAASQISLTRLGSWKPRSGLRP